MRPIHLVLLTLAVITSDTVAQVVNVTCSTGLYPPDPKSKVTETYVIDLDLPPSQRWNELAKAKRFQMQSLVDSFITFLEDFGTIGQDIVNLIDKEGVDLLNGLPVTFAEEIRGISLASGMNIGQVVLYNLFYEFSDFCTSIISEDLSGELFHARNLDFGLFFGWDIKNKTWEMTEKLRPLIVMLDWRRNGQTVFKSVSYAGYTGILTAVKPKLFTLTINERGDKHGSGYIGILKWLLGDRNETWLGFLTRNVLENASGFTQAKTMLENTVMLAPAYFILGGNKSGEGVVITRDRVDNLDTWTMRNASIWYILETNYDHWNPPPFIDDRRTPAHTCMQKMGQINVGFSGLFNVLSTRPVLNKGTTYTALMRVSTGQLETYIQNCQDPCPPW
ncbi:acid ceramidase-like [Biomphalaria glabrata]|uniref:Acid ceramidase n=1 Tax=Biomphalaria glabrata TaxID=6526 RepID=A0A9W3B6W8_BIOGL|nr:acid ceramidase-like [Biomphalaria glabrata]KAI8799042.1 acid ceramidase [Biomphalaria glabrata]